MDEHCGKSVPVVDQKNRNIWLLAHIIQNGQEKQIMAKNVAGRATVWLLHM